MTNPIRILSPLLNLVETVLPPDEVIRASCAVTSNPIPSASIQLTMTASGSCTLDTKYSISIVLPAPVRSLSMGVKPTTAKAPSDI